MTGVYRATVRGATRQRAATMARMDDPSTPPATPPAGPVAAPGPASIPGERRLERAPSERYRPAAIAGDAGADTASAGAAPARGIAFAALAAIALAALITVLGGVALISAGLIVVAAAGGWAVATALRLGARATIAPSRRRWMAVGLAIAGILLGQIGLWLYARSEGGVLPIIDYLGQTFGPLVVLQIAAGGLAAAWAAR